MQVLDRRRGAVVVEEGELGEVKMVDGGGGAVGEAGLLGAEGFGVGI